MYLQCINENANLDIKFTDKHAVCFASKCRISTIVFFLYLYKMKMLAGGVLAGSLAIISDAAHLLTDFASFMISLLALMLATRSPSKKFSFGWYRAGKRDTGICQISIS